MKQFIKLILILNFYLIFPQNIIVDQSSLNQYDKDNYIHFNSFAYYGKFSGNVGRTPPIPLPTDRINLPNTFPVLGNQFTLEAMFYSKPNPLLNTSRKSNDNLLGSATILKRPNILPAPGSISSN